MGLLSADGLTRSCELGIVLAMLNNRFADTCNLFWWWPLY